MKNCVVALSLASIIACCTALKPVSVKAYNADQPYTDDDPAKAAGLLSIYSLSVSNSNGDLSITGESKSNSTMACIGFKNIRVQRSSNGYTWTTECTLTDRLKYNSTGCTLSNCTVSVVGGYYYRVTCNHYADDGAGTTQSVYNASNSVWIS